MLLFFRFLVCFKCVPYSTAYGITQRRTLTTAGIEVAPHYHQLTTGTQHVPYLVTAGSKIASKRDCSLFEGYFFSYSSFK